MLDARIGLTGEFIDALQQRHLVGEGEMIGGILRDIEFTIGAGRRCHDGRGRCRHNGAADLSRTRHRRGGKFGRMRIALGLAAHHPETEALGFIEACRFEPAVVKDGLL